MAWDVCRADGLTGLSLRDVARRVGMQAPSLYSYFDSKHAIYDAMFSQGFRAFADGWPQLAAIRDPLTGMRAVMRYFVDFCTSDPVRYQLLFQRPIPGFEPSPESFTVSVANLRDLSDWLAGVGLADPVVLDLFTALGAGIVAQQLSNEPGGDRWSRLVDEAAEMLLNHVRPGAKTTRRKR